MSGHSKWSQIKHKKSASDQKRGQLFSKLAKKIAIMAKTSTDPTSNFKLQSAIDEARSQNMPKEGIERAIKRASDRNAAVLKEVVIQAMGPSGIALIIEAITDNTNRTMVDIRTILTKNDFKVVPERSLNWMFGKDKNPAIPLEIPDVSLLSKIDKTLGELDANDDVENIYTNVTLP